jgi:glycerol-1-phosphate dehydrogenase [NAD(P)+]
VDGFASGSTPLLVRGFKTTYPGVAPEGIFYDPLVLAHAPDKMTAAGFGDVLAKVVALLDWRLAFVVEDELYCPLVAALVDRAVQECLALADDLALAPVGAKQTPGQSAEALRKRGVACCHLMETLALTGVTMQMLNSTRPASGSDHQISHLLEMRDIQLRRRGSLHGDKVGIGTLIGMVLYQRLFAGRKMPGQRPTLPADVWEREVRRVYGPLAEHALKINQSVPPQGAVWAGQRDLIERAMEQFGYDVVDSFRELLPFARDRILAMGGPVRPDQLGYSVAETRDAIAFGKEVRPKFTTLRLAERCGWLYDLADEIAVGLPQGLIY